MRDTCPARCLHSKFLHAWVVAGRYRELFLPEGGELDISKGFAPLLWGRALSPDDQPAFFRALVWASCGTETYEGGQDALLTKVREVWLDL